MRPDLRPGLLLLALLVAGCTGAGEPPADGTAPPGTQVAPMSGEAAAAPSGSTGMARLRLHEERLLEDIWANGTFRAEQAGSVLDALPTVGQGGALVALDLTPYLPQGVPVLVEAEVTADLDQGDFDLWLEAPPDALWTYRAEAPYGGHSLVQTTMLYTGGDPVQVMLYYDVLEPGTEVPYALRASLRADPDLLVPGVPYALPFGPLQSLELRFVGEAEETAVLLFAPDDRLLLREVADGAQLRLDQGPDDPAGEYVLLLSAGSRAAEVRLGGAEGPVVPRALKQDIVAGSPRTFDPSQGAEWTFQASRPPVQVGYEVEGATVARNMQTHLQGPGGEIFALEWFDDVPWVGRLGWGFFTDVGQEGLLAGTYTARLAYEHAAGDPLVATEYVVHYRR